MSDANLRASNRGYIAVRNVAVSLLEVNPVVVSKFPFHHHFAMNAVAEPSAHSEVVGVGMGNAEVIEKYASLDALLCEQPRRTSAQQKSYNDGSELTPHSVHLVTVTIIAGHRSWARIALVHEGEHTRGHPILSKLRAHGSVGLGKSGYRTNEIHFSGTRVNQALTGDGQERRSSNRHIP